MQNTERILKPTSENYQVTYNGRYIRIVPEILVETLKAKRNWNGVHRPQEITAVGPEYYTQQHILLK